MKKGTILRCMFMCISIALAVLAFELNDSYNLNETVIKTNSTPITNKVIILDARTSVCRMRVLLALQVQLSKQ